MKKLKNKLLLLVLCCMGCTILYAQQAIPLESDPQKITDIKAYIERIDRQLTVSPDSGALYIKKSSLQMALGDYVAARANVTQAIQLNPDPNALFFLYYRRGDLNARLGNPNEAYEDFSKSIELQPKYEWAYLDRGMILSDNGMYQQAEADFRSALAIRPQWGDAYYCLGLNIQDQGDTRQAMAYYEQAIPYMDAESIFHENTYNNMGQLYMEQKKYKEAVQQFDQATRVNPAYALAIVNRASAKYQLGDKAGACADLHRALELGRVEMKSEYEKYCN